MTAARRRRRPGCYNQIALNGGGSSTPTLALLPIQTGLYKNMVIFVDRTQSEPDDIFLNGAELRPQHLGDDLQR